ncbi:MAG: hypothetical protein EOM20_13725, partial [Spartobacteria bacterium]|nr:hypothetical protein [Spartobacteria bacterium]
RMAACELSRPLYLLDDHVGDRADISGLPVYAPSNPDAPPVPVVLLGTDTFQASMSERLQQHMPRALPVDIHHIPAELDSPTPTQPAINLYHCCGHKTASRWVQRLLADPLTERCSGLRVLDYEATRHDGYDPRPVLERFFSEPFEPHRIISPMYISRRGFDSIPKPAAYRAFYVHRDPRDMINSLYFSMRYSHVPIGHIPSLRAELETLTEEEGIQRMLEQWQASGYFACLNEWFSAPPDENVRLVAYEKLTGERQALTLAALFDHCGIPAGIQDICDLLERHSFRSLSGRAAGEEDIHAHYRKGVAGDWRNHFTKKNLATYYALTGDLTEKAGYAVQHEVSDV